MSADNTVIVLKTKGKNGNEAEYRVAHVQAAENMTWEADYPSQDNPRLRRDWVLDIFKGVRVFTNADDALKEADRLEKYWEYVEYGVRVHDFSDIYFPATDRQRRCRERRFGPHYGRRRMQSPADRWDRVDPR